MTYFVYGKDGCSYCTNARDLLTTKGLKFTYTDVMTDRTAFEWIIEKGFKTLPVIYKGQTLVGGFTELKESLEKGV